jgi:signal transduction histidine kinase
MGAVLQLILIMMMARRKDKRHSETLFFVLVVVVFIWHSGNFVITFSRLLTGERIVIVGLIWDTAAALSIGLVPALLIHTLLAFLEEAPQNIYSRRRHLVLLAAYAPLPFFWQAPIRLVQHPELPRAENLLLVIQMFQYWTMAALAVATHMCHTLSSLSQDDVQRRFYMSLVRMFAVIFGLMVFTHLFYAKYIPGLGTYFLAACSLAPMFPTIVFSYFILRYNYMEYVLKRSIYYALLATFVLTVYILGIRRVGDFLERTLDIDFRIIEAILVIGLFLLIDPLREWFTRVFNALFFREQSYYRRVFSELSHHMSSMQGIEVGRMLRYVAGSVQAAMQLSNCRIVLFREEDGQRTIDEASAEIPLANLENIARHFQTIHAHSISLWQAPDPAIVREMKAIDATLVLPIYRDGGLTGIMSLGASTQYRELYEDEIELLSILLNHLITAIDNTRLLQDKIEMERRMAANEKWMTIGRLSGQIAHEVKNPLSSIKAITHVMREELSPETQFYKDLSIVEDEIDKLSGVVSQLLQVSRPASREEHSANLRDIIENVASVLRAKALQDDISIECQYEHGLPTVKADPIALREIVFNLMHNGMQSMSSGGRLSVQVMRSAEDDRRSVTIVVHDTGPGISEEDMPRIFEPFYTTKEGGSGLGLWIVREKLTDLGGTISVESNQGTTVRVMIPLEGKPAMMRPNSSQPQETGNA